MTDYDLSPEEVEALLILRAEKQNRDALKKLADYVRSDARYDPIKHTGKSSVDIVIDWLQGQVND